MKENESKQSNTMNSYGNKDRDYTWSDDEVVEAFERCKLWFLPNLVRNADGVLVDTHIENVFIDNFLMKEGLYRMKLENIYRIKPYLKDYYDELSQIQESKLAQLALFRKVDSTMAKFTLSSKHNWKEKTENVNTNTNKNEFDLKSLIKFK